MKYLIGETSNGWSRLTDTQPRGIGRCYVERPMNPAQGEPSFLDNGVFRVWNQAGRISGLDYTETYARFEKKMPRASELAHDRPGEMLFIVIPDRPGEADSLLTSMQWLEDYEAGAQQDLDAYGWSQGYRAVPLYLAVQDGMTPTELEEMVDPEIDELWLTKIDGIFIGGTDAFKTPENVATWRELCDRHGLALHFGRCTQSRIAEAVAGGCDSADSSHPNRLGTDRWARFLEVHDAELGGPPAPQTFSCSECGRFSFSKPTVCYWCKRTDPQENNDEDDNRSDRGVSGSEDDQQEAPADHRRGPGSPGLRGGDRGPRPADPDRGGAGGDRGHGRGPSRSTHRPGDSLMTHESLTGAIERYVENRIPTGGFLESVLANDLQLALALHDGAPELIDIVRYVCAFVPPDARGSREAVKAWLSGEAVN